MSFLTWSLILSFLIPDPYAGRDFRAFYTAATIAKLDFHQIYDFAAQKEVQRNYGGGVHWHYLNPPPFTVLLLPLAYLPYRTAYWLWTGLTVVLYFAAILLLIRTTPSLRAQEGSIYAVAAAAPAFQWLVITGQTTSLFLFVWAFTYFLLKRQRLVAAGAVLGSLIFRMQYFVILLPLILGKRFTRVMWGLVGSSGVILVFGVFIASFSIYAKYIVVLVEFWARISEELQPLSRHITIYGFVRAYVPAQWAFLLTGIVAVPLVRWLTLMWKGETIFGSARFDLQFSALIVTTLLLMHHGLVYDLLLVTIPALLIFKNIQYFSDYTKLLLMFIYFIPYWHLTIHNLVINPIQPLLYWLSFEIYRAHTRLVSPSRTLKA